MRPTIERALRFAALFGGRTDAYFLSLAKGGRAVWTPVTLALFVGHLEGRQEVGTYPVLDQGLCRWGAIDIDLPGHEDEAHARALDVQAVWRYFGVTAWIERSRSKGFHIWVFTDDWVSASLMRDAGLWVAHIAGLDPATEVNPKNGAPWLTSNGLVNTVRLPYSGKANPGRMVVVDPKGIPLDLDTFTRDALASRAQCSRLAPLAADFRSMRERKERERARSLANPAMGIGRLRGTPSRQRASLLAHGQVRPQRGERDNQFYALANYLHGTGVDYETACHIVEQRWREVDQEDFPLGIALEKVRRVYGGRTI